MELEQIRVKALSSTPDVGWKRAYRDGLKRAIDSVLAVVALVLLWPVMVAIGVLIRLDSPGPALFVQKRIGKEIPAGR